MRRLQHNKTPVTARRKEIHAAVEARVVDCNAVRSRILAADEKQINRMIAQFRQSFHQNAYAFIVPIISHQDESEAIGRQAQLPAGFLAQSAAARRIEGFMIEANVKDESLSVRP